MADLGGARTIVLVPMLKASVLLGTMTVFRQEVRPFTDKQIELVTNFAAQAVIAIENTRLLNELRESLQQQTATADVLKVISRSTFDLRTVLDTLVESAARLCDAPHGLIFRYDGRYCRAVAAYNNVIGFKELWEENPIAPSWATATGRAILESHVVHIPDVLADEEYNPPDGALKQAQKLGQYRTVLVVPMMREGAPLGTLTLWKTEVAPFTEAQIELVKTFADQAVIAIENVRLFDELSESLEQQTATSEVLQVISSSPGELQPVFDAMLANATRICGAKFGMLYRREGDHYRVEAMHGVPPAYAEERQRQPLFKPPGALGRLASAKRAIHIADITKDESYVSIAMAGLAGARTLLTVPMLKDNEVIGAINIYRQEVRRFTDKQVELVSNFAKQAVIAIENTRLLNELRQRTDDLSESLEQQTATSEVLQVISSSPGELEPVFTAMLANATRICGAKFGVLWLTESDGFRSVALHGAPSTFVEARRRKPVVRPGPGTGLGRVARTKQVVHVADLTAEQAYVERDPLRIAIVEQAGARTFVVVPMLKDNELVGAINVYRQEVRPFTDKQIALLTNFANQAVIAIENTRLLNELRESLQQQTATADVLKVISRSTFDLQLVLENLLESAVRLCGADRGLVYRHDGDVYRVAASCGHSPEWLEIIERYPIHKDRTSATGRAVLDRRVVHIHDILADSEYRWAEDLRSKEEMHRTILAVPMLRKGDIIGVIVIRRTRRSAVQRQADRVGHHLRRPGGDRDRERAAVRGRAGAHARALRGAGAADGHRRGPHCHQPVEVRLAADPRLHRRNRQPALRG